MISVLIPSRGRYSRLQRSILTLKTTAAKPDELEFIVRTDNDAPEAARFMTQPIVELRGPRLGYAGMHDYFNELAAAAKGEYLLIWNDDTEMLTPKWDELLLGREEAGRSVQFIRRDEKKTADDTFPLVPKVFYDVLGHLSLHCYVDTWLSRVGKACNAVVFRDDVVFHHHRLNDETMSGQQSALAKEHHRFESLEMQMARLEDEKKLREYLEQIRELRVNEATKP